MGWPLHESLSCHLFRHAAATSMLNAGTDIRYVQEMLGHSDISSTQVYMHVAIKQLEKVYQRTHPAAGKNTIDQIRQ